MAAMDEVAVRSIVTEMIEAFEARIESRVAVHVKEKVDKQDKALGTLIKNAQDIIVRIDAKTAELDIKTLDAETRVTSLVDYTNIIKTQQEEIGNFALKLRQETSDSFDVIVGNFKNDIEQQKVDLKATQDAMSAALTATKGEGIANVNQLANGV